MSADIWVRAFNFINGQLTVQDSSDAINWTPEPSTSLPGLATPYAAFFAEENWLVIGADSEGTIWSWTDDLTLDGSTKSLVGCSGIPLGVQCFNAVSYVLAVANDQNSHSTYFYTSPYNDGNTWTRVSSIPARITGFALAVGYSDNVVAIANTGQTWVSSDSAATWSPTSSLPAGQWSVTHNYEPATYVAWTSQSIYYSPDGVTWTESTIAGVQGVTITDLTADSYTNWVAVGWKYNSGVVVGNTLPSLVYYYGTSTDGITFTFQEFPVQPNSADKVFSPCAGDFPWIVMGQGSVLNSSDLQNWTSTLNTSYLPCQILTGLYWWWC